MATYTSVDQINAARAFDAFKKVVSLIGFKELGIQFVHPRSLYALDGPLGHFILSSPGSRYRWENGY